MVRTLSGSRLSTDLVRVRFDPEPVTMMDGVEAGLAQNGEAPASQEVCRLVCRPQSVAGSPALSPAVSRVECIRRRFGAARDTVTFRRFALTLFDPETPRFDPVSSEIYEILDS